MRPFRSPEASVRATWPSPRGNGGRFGLIGLGVSRNLLMGESYTIAHSSSSVSFTLSNRFGAAPALSFQERGSDPMTGSVGSPLSPNDRRYRGAVESPGSGSSRRYPK